jgi:hypothetical protein
MRKAGQRQRHTAASSKKTKNPTILNRLADVSAGLNTQTLPHRDAVFFGVNNLKPEKSNTAS